MSNSGSFPFPYGEGAYDKAQYIKLSPVMDSEGGDNNLEPPFVRVRAPNNAVMFLDTNPEDEYNPGSNTARWTVGSGGPQSNSSLYMRKMKRLTNIFEQFSWNTPNCNIKNNQIKFRMSTHPTITLTIDIPTYNYFNFFKPRIAVQPAQVTTIPSGWSVTQNYAAAQTFTSLNPPLATSTSYTEFEFDPNDGVLDIICSLMNAAIATLPAPPITVFTAVPSDGYRDTFPNTVTQKTNCRFWRIGNTPAIPFAFEKSTFFDRGKWFLGVQPIPANFNFAIPGNYSAVYTAGPALWLYTRWIDIISSRLTQWQKLANAGTAVISDLMDRVYITENEQRNLGLIRLEKFEGASKNWRIDDAISSVDLRLEDEYREPIVVPTRAKNAGTLSTILTAEL